MAFNVIDNLNSQAVVATFATQPLAQAEADALNFANDLNEGQATIPADTIPAVQQYSVVSA